MEKQKIIDLLSFYDSEDVERFASYCIRLLTEKKDGELKNTWMLSKTDESMATLFKRVHSEGLKFDGVHVTLQSTGVTYDYVALKNKMLLVYPESIIDLNLVMEGDEFEFTKENGKIEYKHIVKSPFSEKEIIGGYAIIKNKRGEFLTTLGKEEIEKHRKTAKGDFIWKMWFKEMALKTIMKKACKLHFGDIYTSIEEQDNENYELENPLSLSLKLKQEIDEIKTKEELKKYYELNKGKGKDFDKYISLKLKQLC